MLAVSGVFESIVVVVFQSVFRLEMHHNNIFYFKNNNFLH
jgi:hypothetical protein